jgi:transcriptional regulator with XRE-family HTH domain
VDVAQVLQAARARAGLSQSALAARAGTSQATISAYESGRKAPSVDTLSRLLAASGSRLAVENAPPIPLEPSPEEKVRRARILVEVLALAEALPARHYPRLRFPRLPQRTK